MKIYGSYTDADLDHWQSLPMNSKVLTQSAFGAWLLRRDENKAKQFPKISLEKVKQAREEMKEHSYSLKCFNEDVFDEDERVVDLDDVLIILDKLIEEVEG